MSSVRHFDGVPHIVRYGMKDDEKQKSWMLFWRNGVGFEVRVQHDDVRDTPFAEAWLDLLTEPKPSDPSFRKGGFVDRWNDFCDLVLGQCLPLLKELAPEDKQWVTLDDYLHTPSYDLKMEKVPKSTEVAPSINDGPKDKPSYENWPTAAANIEYLPQGAPRFHARDLIVLDKEKNWRAPPGKVKLADGQVFDFFPCKKSSQLMPDKIFSNNSIDVINMYSRLQGRDMAETNIQQLKAVVVTKPSKDIEDSSPSVGWKDEPEAGYQYQTRTDDQLVAGILLTLPPESKSLSELLEDENNKPTTAQKEKWRSEIVKTVEYLHRCGIAIGGREKKDNHDAWFYINRYTVRIVSQEDEGTSSATAWLSLNQVVFSAEDDKPDEKARFERAKEIDVEAIEKTFGF